MNQKEVGELLNDIKAAYPNFMSDVEPARVFKVWCNVLADYDGEQVNNAFIKYVQNSDFPPRPNQLIKELQSKGFDYKVPGVEETKVMLDKYDAEIAESRKNSLTPEQIQELFKKSVPPEVYESYMRRKRGTGE